MPRNEGVKDANLVKVGNAHHFEQTIGPWSFTKP